MDKEILLSVVIISRNEEKNIARCIESIIKAVEEIGRWEVILVDSASTDKTIEIASRYPVKIIKLKKTFPLSPAAGRYIGFLRSHGRYIQFQDGDTILDEYWFKTAIPVLEMNPEIAGVVGITTQEEYDTRSARDWIRYSFGQQKVGPISYYEGDVLFKREVLDKIGPFNPYLKAIEEGELCDRLAFNGFKLVRLPYQMTHHFGYFDESFLDFLKKKAVMNIAQGQILRYSLYNRDLFLNRFKKFKFIVFFSVWLLVAPIIISTVIFTDHTYLVYSWLLLWCGMILAVAYEKRKLPATINHVSGLFIRAPFFIRGFLAFPGNPEDYPQDVEVIK